MPRYLTKSNFILALDCPTKLYYTGKDQYPNKNSDNDFLDALAKGGYQVGALAKCYYPQGNTVNYLNSDEAIQKTNELLKNKNVVIFEAAFQVDRFFIRVDILEKKGDQINLIEVKSKSFDGNSSLDMLKNVDHISPEWEKYVYDVAYQKFVFKKAMPEWEIHAYLMLANKRSVTTVDGLNQKFLLRNQINDRSYVEIMGDVSPASLGNEILLRVNVDDLCELIYEGKDSEKPLSMPFADYCAYLADHYCNDKKIIIPVHKECGKCEFRATLEEEKDNKISGFRECWSQQKGWQVQNSEKPMIFEIWNYSFKQKLIDEGIYYMDQLTPEHIGKDTGSTDEKLSRQARQWLQVNRTVSGDPEPYINIEGIRNEMDNWVYPLHMIDFETSTVAIPFNKDRRPYEDVAFQFSHHIINKDGSIEHKGQYLNVERGVFPNFEFVRKLKAELLQDEGSVFRYAPHENTILNHILVQLQESDEPDKPELIDFIQTITHSANHKGNRDMIDLLEIVKYYYWHPLMKGSNSLKAVLPAILNSSEYLREKYSKPIYGRNLEIKSLNYPNNWCWIQYNDQINVISPYKLLPKLFVDLDEENIEGFLMGDSLADGGAAMTAYGMMQFTQMHETERERIIQGLLKYCELDTMAMVFIWEYWWGQLH